MTKVGGATCSYLIASGFLFAFLQTGFFFQLQFRLTSAYPSFLAVTLAWLVGSGAGLWLGRKENCGGRTAWLVASLAAFSAASYAGPGLDGHCPPPPRRPSGAVGASAPP